MATVENISKDKFDPYAMSMGQVVRTGVAFSDMMQYVERVPSGWIYHYVYMNNTKVYNTVFVPYTPPEKEYIFELRPGHR